MLRKYFVAAPGREIHVPLVQLQGHVAHGMGQIPARNYSGILQLFCYSPDVKQLPGVVLNSGQQSNRDFRSGSPDCLKNVFSSEDFLASPRLQENDGIFFIAMKFNLGENDVLKRIFSFIKLLSKKWF